MFLADSEKIVHEAKETRTKAVKKVKDLEDKIKNAKAIRERELKEAEQSVAKAKKALDESKKKTKEKEQVCYVGDGFNVFSWIWIYKTWIYDIYDVCN